MERLDISNWSLAWRPSTGGLPRYDTSLIETGIMILIGTVGTVGTIGGKEFWTTEIQALNMNSRWALTKNNLYNLGSTSNEFKRFCKKNKIKMSSFDRKRECIPEAVRLTRTRRD